MMTIRKGSVWVLSWAAICCINSESFSQQDTTSLDMLLAPGAPGFVLLGVAPTLVDRPADVTDFAVDVLNSTSNITALPQNYAIEVAPYWFFSHPDLSYDQFAGDNGIIATAGQTFSLSVATSSVLSGGSDVVSTGMGLGARFSLLRGRIDNEFSNYRARLDSVMRVAGEISAVVASEIAEKYKTDPVIVQLKTMLTQAAARNDTASIAAINQALQVRGRQLHYEVESSVRSQYRSELERVREEVQSIQVRRVGWKLEVAGGAVLNFPGQNFDSSSVSRYGGWINGGYDLGDYCALGVVRYLADVGNSAGDVVEAGARLVLNISRKLSLSGEGVYRGYPNGKSRTGWRFDIEVDYSVGKNSAVAFTFGRDSHGHQTGTLISALNLLIGFGSGRPL